MPWFFSFSSFTFLIDFLLFFFIFVFCFLILILILIFDSLFIFIMQNYYIVFDRQNSRVGFAPLVSCK